MPGARERRNGAAMALFTAEKKIMLNPIITEVGKSIAPSELDRHFEQNEEYDVLKGYYESCFNNAEDANMFYKVAYQAALDSVGALWG